MSQWVEMFTEANFLTLWTSTIERFFYPFQTGESLMGQQDFKPEHTVACIIVRRLQISVHKWQSSGMADTHE